MGQLISSKNFVKPSDRNGLILYYHPLSYYSQKVSLLTIAKNWTTQCQLKCFEIVCFSLWNLFIFLVPFSKYEICDWVKIYIMWFIYVNNHMIYIISLNRQKNKKPQHFVQTVYCLLGDRIFIILIYMIDMRVHSYMNCLHDQVYSIHAHIFWYNIIYWLLRLGNKFCATDRQIKWNKQTDPYFGLIGAVITLRMNWLIQGCISFKLFISFQLCDLMLICYFPWFY